MSGNSKNFVYRSIQVPSGMNDHRDEGDMDSVELVTPGVRSARSEQVEERRSPATSVEDVEDEGRQYLAVSCNPRNISEHEPNSEAFSLSVATHHIVYDILESATRILNISRYSQGFPHTDNPIGVKFLRRYY
ncbi:hypothetical protein CYLTODRAFT_426605 [Cylindrobasidium torrendii FP15055 ss-10]|uniref:Uncharacterized protein n=1 Tax=Cylindrobasidium torrendii FP15055 ss-10 TaxID=1314674 RepID=A0A0D7AY88_9AGAR|nr:hypothetical protein CYLTODRAFT_426605 [Cylindrobasidium torrendii FP15055 ss-10]